MTKYFIIGGGIAGLTCAEKLLELCKEKESDSTITLISATTTLKAVGKIEKITPRIEFIEVTEKSSSEIQSGIQFVQAFVNLIDVNNKIIKTTNGDFQYDKLCICSGASPNVIFTHDNVIGIRDTDSIQALCSKLEGAKKVVLVGNGGIALELISAIQNVELIWSIKDDYIGSTFFDQGASAFLLPDLPQIREQSKKDSIQTESKSITQKLEAGGENSNKRQKLSGASLGPGWIDSFSSLPQNQANNVTIKFQTEATEISQDPPSNYESTSKWPLYVTLSSGEVIGCDFLISATGVLPYTNFCGKEFNKSEDGGLIVNQYFETNVPDVFAAGDVCECSWDFEKHWFQMKLWTQARAMGIRAACSMVDKSLTLEDFNFEMFTHVTKFFNYRVTLLGLFNGQKLDQNFHALLRCSPGEYIKVIVSEGKVQGALIIGDTELDETFENLILNQLDISHLEDKLLDPDIDIEDYFD